MTKRKPLEFDPGTGFPLCDKCAEKLEDYALFAACASVGIEYGKTSYEMQTVYLRTFHAKGHK